VDVLTILKKIIIIIIISQHEHSAGNITTFGTALHTLEAQTVALKPHKDFSIPRDHNYTDANQIN